MSEKFFALPDDCAFNGIDAFCHFDDFVGKFGAKRLLQTLFVHVIGGENAAHHVLDPANNRSRPENLIGELAQLRRRLLNVEAEKGQRKDDDCRGRLHFDITTVKQIVKY